MSGNTPGPWANDCFMVTSQGDGYRGGMYGGSVICHTGIHDIRNGKEAEANARLIAAAPEMLEALEGLREIIAAIDELRRTNLQVYGWHLNGDPEDFDKLVPCVFDASAKLEAAIAKAKGTT